VRGVGKSGKIKEKKKEQKGKESSERELRKRKLGGWCELGKYVSLR